MQLLDLTGSDSIFPHLGNVAHIDDNQLSDVSVVSSAKNIFTAFQWFFLIKCSSTTFHWNPSVVFGTYSTSFFINLVTFSLRTLIKSHMT